MCVTYPCPEEAIERTLQNFKSPTHLRSASNVCVDNFKNCADLNYCGNGNL